MSIKKKISIIVPVLNEEESIAILIKRIDENLSRIIIDYELVFVDDGSTDATFDILQDKASNDSRIVLISLSRRFGKDAALLAGLENCTGDGAIPIDADMQDPPEIIPQMLARWRDGYDVVCAVRRQRQESFFKKFSAHMFYSLLSRISNTPVYPDVGDFRLLDRCAIDAVLLLPERNLFMKGLMSWVGFRTCCIFYDRPCRQLGSSKWSFASLIGFAFDGITSFSNIPLYSWIYFGALVSFLSVSYGFYLIAYTLFTGVTVPGYVTLMTAVLFMGGLQLISIGVLGQYVGRIFTEVKQRPRYIIRKSYNLLD